jgi:hypothetical protein
MSHWVKFRNRETGEEVVARPVGVQNWEVAPSPNDDPRTVDPATFDKTYEFPELSAIDVLAAQDDDEAADTAAS